ncbi:MAG: RNA polymerase sigma factor [Phycisphaerae bacterium]|jgi:RNA polymerase sigma-70 factor (ECF subfamily)|nr:RNA polymerase sigma factor [Phycisphaerae bacterium]
MSGTVSEDSLRHWMQRLGPGLIAHAAGICRNRHRAEELVQEAFVKLWRSPPDAGEPAYSSWLRTTVTNLAINALQREKRPGALPDECGEPLRGSEGTPQRQLERAEDLARVEKALARLEPDKRAMLMLRVNEHMSYEAIAEHLGVPVGTVMSRLNRARLALLGELDANFDAKSATPSSYDINRYREA